MLLSVTEFKAKCLSILARIQSSGESVTLTKRGAVIAKIHPVKKGRGAALLDPLRGSVKVVGDILGPVLPPEDWEAEGARARRKLASKRLSSLRSPSRESDGAR